LKQSSDFDLRVRGTPKLCQKKFGWLRNITNSAGIRLAAKKLAAAQCRLIKFGAVALSSGAGIYSVV